MARQPHDLRHTCASLARSAGVNVLTLQRMLGHKESAELVVSWGGVPQSALWRGCSVRPGVDTGGSLRRVERGMVMACGQGPLQAKAQVVPLWVRPIARSRRRLSAALRWCSQ